MHSARGCRHRCLPQAHSLPTFTRLASEPSASAKGASTIALQGVVAATIARL